MTTSSDAPAPTPLPAAGNEIDTLLGALDRNRRTFAWKAFGLSDDEMRRALGPSTMTLGGLAKHLALVEDYYFSLGLGEVMPQPWRDVDFDANPDWEWHSAAEDSAEELQGLWTAAVDRSRSATAAFLADGSPDAQVRWSEHSQTPNLRRTLVDMIEEYARHTGHADLIRESIDGLVGEDRPVEDGGA
ncbi:MAG TPA: DinB family protein [Nocardioides sp.]|uniref:DinB family protein n=1 Tax=uncultured Nocardioides sp. TaxID=198441 RepID=UPI000ED4EABE|nr:DinB family protein [uncultured Nocardioides sp.]HCB02882.1 mini-circle protein [Nocardioides sp.]HRD63913.1 DinB family protein [Nocardioides sp.]HRI97606.1 DinB family protein [Nocardioides sp.]